jgi:glutamine cyclotransferase
MSWNTTSLDGRPAPIYDRPQNTNRAQLLRRSWTLHKRLLAATAFIVALLAAGCSGGGESAVPTPRGVVEVLGSVPHQGRAWTEGLLVSDGVLWESVGGNVGSQVRGLDRETGAVVWSVPNDDAFFAEGLVRAFGRIYVLSYTEGTAYIFDQEAPQPFKPFAHYEGQGWGLTAAGSYLVNSNGTSNLYYRDPDTFQVIKTVPIVFQNEPVMRLNELEYDGTYLWANEWRTSYVYRILESDPTQIIRYILPPDVCPEGHPNGIAWDEEMDLFFVTGQQCESIWKVRFR